MIDPLLIAAGVCGVLCVLFLFAFIAASRKRKFLGAVRNFTFTFLMLVLALLFATISVSLKGYKALTHEELAALVEIQPVSEQKFVAHFTFPDKTEYKFELSGDELYVDAHILKWKSFANLFGLHTFYELDRVAGRYSDIEEETSKDRTVFSLGKEKIVNIFDRFTNIIYIFRFNTKSCICIEKVCQIGRIATPLKWRWSGDFSRKLESPAPK